MSAPSYGLISFQCLALRSISGRARMCSPLRREGRKRRRRAWAFQVMREWMAWKFGRPSGSRVIISPSMKDSGVRLARSKRTAAPDALAGRLTYFKLAKLAPGHRLFGSMLEAGPAESSKHLRQRRTGVEAA